MKNIIILGCTGSIGTSTLDIISEYPDLYNIVGLTANTNIEKLLILAKKFNCTNLCLSSPGNYVDERIKYYGNQGISKLITSTEADIVVNGIAGASGLFPSLCTVSCGIDLALANKETVVMAYPILSRIAQEKNCNILPVDSEHSAIFNLIQKYGKENIDSIVLTASGGPFRLFTEEQLKKVTVQDALQHPTWKMGKKITIDSATLSNKGLEVIEACRLFDLPKNKVDVTIHPQSLVHSLIRTKDGVLYGQISKPDMRHPILSALSWPVFMENKLDKLDLWGNNSTELTFTFSKPDLLKFPMLKLAYSVASLEGAYTIAYNAANEIAVQKFINKEISFYDISNITEKTLQHDWSNIPVTYDDVIFFDKQARIIASGGSI